MACIYTHTYTHVHTCMHTYMHTHFRRYGKMVFTFSSSTMVTISLLTYLLNTVHVTRQAFYNTPPQHTHTRQEKIWITELEVNTELEVQVHYLYQSNFSLILACWSIGKCSTHVHLWLQDVTSQWHHLKIATNAQFCCCSSHSQKHLMVETSPQ